MYRSITQNDVRGIIQSTVQVDWYSFKKRKYSIRHCQLNSQLNYYWSSMPLFLFYLAFSIQKAAGSCMNLGVHFMRIQVYMSFVYSLMDLSQTFSHFVGVPVSLFVGHHFSFCFDTGFHFYRTQVSVSFGQFYFCFTNRLNFVYIFKYWHPMLSEIRFYNFQN